MKLSRLWPVPLIALVMVEHIYLYKSVYNRQSKESSCSGKVNDHENRINFKGEIQSPPAVPVRVSSPSLSPLPPAKFNYLFDSPPALTDEWISKKLANVRDSDREFCRSIFEGGKSASQAQQDTYLFWNYFSAISDFDEEGVYLDLGGNDAKELSNTYFLDVCLGWKGVVLEPNPQYANGYSQFRSARLVPHCIHQHDMKEIGFMFNGVYGEFAQFWKGPAGDLQRATQVTCYSLEHILKENKDILGPQDEFGAWGTKINFVSVDIEGAEAGLLGCTNIKGLFSSKPSIQVWAIENNHHSGPNLRVVDAAMLMAGYWKSTAFLQYDRTFLDDIYVQHRRKRVLKEPEQLQCRDGKRLNCSLSDMMNHEDNGNGFPFNCDA